MAVAAERGLFLSLLAAAAVLALVWVQAALWAHVPAHRRSVMPWAMRMSPRQGWSTVHRSTAR